MANDLLTQALRAGRQSSAPALPSLRSALVIGAGGVLGSAVLAEALAAGRFGPVRALVSGPLVSALRGFEAWPLALLAPALAASAASTALPVASWDGRPPADTAFIVFERARHSNGRDDAFYRPEPADLLPLASALRRQGVARLVVVVPHAPALLPVALKAGLATLDETAVAALGFEQLVFIRAAQDGGADAAAGAWLPRFARWWLSQLRWMVPQQEQPVRAVKLAALAVQLARWLPLAAQGTRVVPPELLWQAVTSADAEAVLHAWLLGTPLRDGH